MRRTRLFAGLIRTFASIAILAFVAGFVAYAASLAEMAPPVDPTADGIVVLTGGSARIAAGVQLLREERGQRLFITGVNANVDTDEMFRAADVAIEELACCVDVDRAAVDTVGNAAETRAWIEQHGYTSLIVVTSDFHMARALTEFGLAMPGIEFTAFPVPNTRADVSEWWRSGPAFRMVAFEYVKLVSTWIRRGAASLDPRAAA